MGQEELLVTDGYQPPKRPRIPKISGTDTDPHSVEQPVTTLTVSNDCTEEAQPFQPFCPIRRPMADASWQTKGGAKGAPKGKGKGGKPVQPPLPPPSDAEWQYWPAAYESHEAPRPNNWSDHCKQWPAPPEQPSQVAYGGAVGHTTYDQTYQEQTNHPVPQGKGGKGSKKEGKGGKQQPIKPTVTHESKAKAKKRSRDETEEPTKIRPNGVFNRLEGTQFVETQWTSDGATVPVSYTIFYPAVIKPRKLNRSYPTGGP